MNREVYKHTKEKLKEEFKKEFKTRKERIILGGIIAGASVPALSAAYMSTDAKTATAIVIASFATSGALVLGPIYRDTRKEIKTQKS